MSDIQMMEEKRTPCPELTGKALMEHANQLFQMFAGDAVDVKMRFHRDLANAVIDKFGRNTMLIPDGADHFVFTVKVAVSPMFLSWVIGFGKMARILYPASVVAQCRQMCLDALDQPETEKESSSSSQVD
jgi:predicted DNA-binding transcriptional regulator YafY